MAKQMNKANESARNTDGDVIASTNGALAPATPLEERFLKLQNKVAAGDFMFEKRESMVPGKPVAGIFLGLGPYVWVEDPSDAKMENRICTWRIQVAPNMVVQVAGAAQMDAKMVIYPVGDDILIQLLAEKGESKRGRRYNDYLISTPESGWAESPHTVVEPSVKRPRDTV